MRDQLTSALPKMAQAANNPKAERGRREASCADRGTYCTRAQSVRALGEQAEPKPWQGHEGLTKRVRNDRGQLGKEPLAADLALIPPPSVFEHYEIALCHVRLWPVNWGVH